MTKKIKFITSGFFLALAGLASLFLYHSGQTDIASIDEQAISAKAINQRLLDDALTQGIININQENVTSLSGIKHETNILTDAQGNLRVDESIKELFEFYLSSLGEEALEQILLRIQSELNSQLKPPALDQALSLLKRYVDYKIELATIEQEAPFQIENGNSEIENIKYQKSQMNDLRLSYFNQEEYQQFFEREVVFDNYMITHLEIVSDQTLDKEEKQQSIKALEKTLPEELRSVRKKVSLHGNLYEQAKKMKSEGSSDEEIFQIREQSLGAEAARALAKLDNDRVKWQQRLTDYAQQRNTIMDSGLSQQDQLLAINDLIDTNFSGTERLRVKALNSSL